jgi:hypothetical protein
MSKQKYIPYKLGRRTDAFHKGPAAVSDGQIFGPSTAHVYDYKKGEAVQQDKFIPEIGQCVWIQGRGFSDYVRTSLIQDFYIHDDYENSKDKIVLKPENAHLLDTIQFNKGDVLLITMNSLYFLKAE